MSEAGGGEILPNSWTIPRVRKSGRIKAREEEWNGEEEAIYSRSRYLTRCTSPKTFLLHRHCIPIHHFDLNSFDYIRFI